MGVLFRGLGGWLSKNLGGVFVGYEASKVLTPKAPATAPAPAPNNDPLGLASMKPFMPFIILIVLVSMIKK